MPAFHRHFPILIWLWGSHFQIYSTWLTRTAEKLANTTHKTLYHSILKLKRWDLSAVTQARLYTAVWAISHSKKTWLFPIHSYNRPGLIFILLLLHHLCCCKVTSISTYAYITQSLYSGTFSLQAHELLLWDCFSFQGMAVLTGRTI